MLIASFGARRKALIRFYPCKLIFITFSAFVQFERVQLSSAERCGADEARLYQPMPHQIPHGKQSIDPHAFGLQGKEFYIQHNSLTQHMITKIPR